MTQVKNDQGNKQLDALQRDPVFIPERIFNGFSQAGDLNEKDAAEEQDQERQDKFPVLRQDQGYLSDPPGMTPGKTAEECKCEGSKECPDQKRFETGEISSGPAKAVRRNEHKKEGCRAQDRKDPGQLRFG